jgi:hypothetical protein
MLKMNVNYIMVYSRNVVNHLFHFSLWNYSLYQDIKID